MFTTLLIASCTVSKTTSPLHPFRGGQLGCGNFVVYKLTEDEKAYISVSYVASAYQFKETQSFEISVGGGVKVRWKKFEESIRSSLCNDVRTVNLRPTLDQTAESGSVEVRIDQNSLSMAEDDKPYEVTLVLKNIVFDGLVVDYLQIENVTVGWMPG